MRTIKHENQLRIKGIIRLFSGFLLLVLMTLSQQLSARVWTVDNSPGAGADTSSLPGCMFLASTGDTIIVMPSYTNYGAITFSKRLFMYSRGHSSNNLDKDKRAAISNVTFATGSDGSVFKGLYVTSGTNLSTSNNTLIDNYFTNSLTINGSNNVVQGNILDGYNMISFSSNAQNNIVINNYFNCYLTSGSFSNTNYLVSGGNSSNLFANNFVTELIAGSTSISGGGFNFFANSYIKIYNNILWSNVPSRAEFNKGNLGSIFKNNVTYSANSNPTVLPGFNYNDSLPEFEGGYNNSKLPFYSPANDMRLKSSSIGKNGGTDSTDVGLYGQNYNFSLEGNVPGIAIFDDFEVLNPVLKKGGILKVKVVARKPK